jgi:hypothetical protein
MTWPGASGLATRSLGYLATIGSGPENQLVFGLIDSPTYWMPAGTAQAGPWIGGMQTPGAEEPAGGWKWVTGEPFTFTAWREGEPNDVGGGEDRVNYMGIPDGGRDPFWNDAGGGSLMPGLVVEWDVLPGWRYGDFDANGRIDLSDFGILKANFGNGTTPAQGNANFDDTVDNTDFGILKENFGTAPNPASGSVPEPSALGLAALAACGALLSALRRRAN